MKGGKEKAEKNYLVSRKKRKSSSEGSRLGTGEPGWPRVGTVEELSGRVKKEMGKGLRGGG